MDGYFGLKNINDMATKQSGYKSNWKFIVERILNMIREKVFSTIQESSIYFGLENRFNLVKSATKIIKAALKIRGGATEYLS